MAPKGMHGKDLIILLKKAGFKVVGERGGHVSVRKGNIRLIIPAKEALSEKTLNNLIEAANLSPKEMAALLSGKEVEIEPEPEEEKFVPEVDEEEEREELHGIRHNFFQLAWFGMTRSFPMSLVRMVIGMLFVITAIETAPWASFGWFPDLIRNMVAYPSLEFLRSFLTMAVQPNMAIWGTLHFLLNLSIGMSLIIGFFGRFWSCIGFFWSLALLMLRVSNPNWWIWSDIMMVMLFFMFWTMKASRTFGIDQAFAEWLETYEDNRFARFVMWFV